ncbi:cryptochrome/photolyase family protein [Streptomonospora litoralis]|uniref:Deoxyribodipyrimidine photo-lyase-related protein n=1 Tax=Streptomonospora litoralis TaxID=2498135 RepID=A0A4P6Q0B0_9ACTN|nr:cryptochrome/photolyase family protein [Streptomonospora litoralis]QBI53500.1 Deoxyribodipyrimidine photo-lyase-related protein [Streptomonospora litoralis]
MAAANDRAPLWLFGDQLGPHFHSARGLRDREVLLVVSRRALARHRYHRQKLHLVLSAMRHLAAELGERATLIEDDTYRAALRRFGRPVAVHEPGSHAAARLVRELHRDGLVCAVLPTAGFALSRAEFERWVGDRRSPRMEDFYRAQRRRFDVLMADDGTPQGGEWNYDRDNRAAPPRHRSTLGVPGPWNPVEDGIDDRVRRDLDRMSAQGAIDPVGRDGPRRFAATRAEAQRALRRFLGRRLPDFGPYQDAMLHDDWAMSHALLSVPLNLGLLDPLTVVRKAEREYTEGRAPLNSVEGFVRQVLGWREYIWQLYWHLGPDYTRSNVLDARTPLPEWWRDPEPDAVEAACLSAALAGVRDRGWVHHIQRLMVLGNHALQRGYRPDELNAWFATAFVDGFPWVMPANVVGMSQYADGGIAATKPYASGGAYIRRMSDHCDRCRFDPRERRGEAACPFTAGYWAWLHRNADRLAGNHRMARAVASMRRLDDIGAVVDQEAARRYV